jgi:hypothetical protein
VEETLSISSPESSAADSRKWIGRLLIAVVLGDALWGFLLTITNCLAVPAMARVIGGDPQSPLYLGKGDFNIPALFTSVLELCFAGIVAVLLNSWSQKPGRVRLQSARRVAVAAPAPAPVVALPAPPAPATAPVVVSAPQAKATVTTEEPTPQPMRPQPTPPQPPPPQATKPAKPKAPKPVYYNIVGEPLEPDDE